MKKQRTVLLVVFWSSLVSIVKEIGQGRDLIRELVIKDLKLRYSRPMLGFFWALILPLSTVFIFFVVFSLFLKVKVEEAPYILYLMTAVFTWRFFQDSLSGAASSLMDNRNLLREARFPAYLIPLSVVLANGINFLPCLLIMIASAFFMMKGLPAFVFLLPVVLAIHFLVTAGLSIVFSILYLKWRDVRYILETVLTFLFYLTPAFYSLSFVRTTLSPALFRLYLCNPLTGILNLYRCSIIKDFPGFVVPDGGIVFAMISPVLFGVLILGGSLYFYKRNRDAIYDHLSY